MSISTTARFIRTFKEYGKISVKKSEVATNDLINRLIAENPNLNYEELSKLIQKLQAKGHPRREDDLAGTRFRKK